MGRSDMLVEGQGANAETLESALVQLALTLPLLHQHHGTFRSLDCTSFTAHHMIYRLLLPPRPTLPPRDLVRRFLHSLASCPTSLQHYRAVGARLIARQHHVQLEWADELQYSGGQLPLAPTELTLSLLLLASLPPSFAVPTAVLDKYKAVRSSRTIFL